MMHPAILGCAVALLCLPSFAFGALAQSAADQSVRASEPMPRKNVSRAIRRDAKTARAIIIVSGRGRNASRTIKRPHLGGPAALNPQPLPPKALPVR